MSAAILRCAAAAVILCFAGCRSEVPEEAQSAAGTEHRADAHGEQVLLSASTLAASGVEVEVASGRDLSLVVELPGEAVPNADRLAHIVPSFPGITKAVKKTLGDAVQEGEVLAIIESNESLSPYEVTSLISGTIIEKHITLGEFVRDDADIFIVADLSTVWINITVYARDLVNVKRGLRVEVVAVGGFPKASGSIDYIGPVLGEATRAATARLLVENPQRAWRPGMFVTAQIEIDQSRVPVAVRAAAVQSLRGQNVVFIQEGDAFEPRPVIRGRSDGEWVEVQSGLEAGARYAARGSFVLKSELLKSEAGHEH
jgi:cobalt-zinc-cadmium efflux system membrane fusion protein